MRAGGRRVMGYLVGCLVGVFTMASGVALAQGSPSGDGSGASSLFEGPLVVPGVQSLDGGQQLRAQEQTRLVNPDAVAIRKESRTRFEHLGAARAAKVAREAFPAIVERPAGGPPQVPAGGRITHYVADNAAQLVLPGGKHAVVESAQPMAIETSPGHRAPVDLGLRRAGGAFESARPVVGVLIPQRLSGGVELLERGVSLTPVSAQGSPLGGSTGAVDGAGVLYANTQTDTDTLVKPTTSGVETTTLLRSIDSPAQLYFRVGLPAGATLSQNKHGLGPVRVLQDGRTIALVLPPSATDAVGAPVPVSMTVHGSLLALVISTHAGEYQWPIAVDPELAVVTDRDAHGETYALPGNWAFQTNSGNFRYTAQNLDIEHLKPAGVGEYADIQYHTQGESKIYGLKAEGRTETERGRARLQLLYQVKGNEGTLENSITLGEKSFEKSFSTVLCPGGSEKECSPTEGHAGNLAWLRIEAVEPEAYLEGKINYAEVYVAQEKGPVTSFNEAEPEIDSGRSNVLYKAGSWLSPTEGAFEAKAQDPGIGVAFVNIGVGAWHHEENIFNGGTENTKCLGIQCKEKYSTFMTYNPEMPNGEDVLEWKAWDLAGGSSVNRGEGGLEGKRTQVVKVDGTPPYNIAINGWPTGNREITAASHALTIEATDGTAPAASSGVASISVAVDGGAETPVPGLTCSTGTCMLGPTTAKGKWTLNAVGLSEGVHRLIVTAVDNAGNKSAKEFTFDVRHGSSLSVGPGSVDPTSGQLKLSATDVSLAGSGGVSRTYESRNLTAGLEGPLGPQWAISLGGGEGLTVLPTGSVVLAGSAGSDTTFTLNSEGKFESPLGDGNLKVEAKEKVPGKGITEYLLNEPIAGSTTTFTQPVGTESTTPVYTNQFGSEAGQSSRLIGVAIDSSSNEWVTDQATSRVFEFSRSGVLLASYGSYGTSQGQYSNPRGIAINQSTGNVYVNDEGNNRIVELSSSGQFIKVFGWGVSDGKAQLESCTIYCQSGIAGSGGGQLKEAKGMTLDSSGNLWVADYGNNRIQEFSSSGAYLKTIAPKEGAGAGEFKGPFGIAVSGGNLYIVEYFNNRVQEFSTAGVYIAQFGGEGTSNGKFKSPRDIATDPITGNLYVVDSGNLRVQEFKASGAFITKFGASGTGPGQFSEPKGVAISSSGGVYVTDYYNSRLEEWSRPTWLPTLAQGSQKSSATTYAYQAVEVEEGKWIVEPTEALAPVLSGVSCGTKPAELKKGCRALTFTYATATSATGVNPGQWGSFKAHLTSIAFHGWDPSKGAMAEPLVAQYEYDNKGQLRAEWDPRVSPGLKTTYGYDAEGHVVSLSPPGQEPWLMHYGALAGDPSTGRLLSLTRPAASSSTLLKEQKAMAAPANTTVPTLSSTTPVVGTTLSVSSNGAWSNSPLSYSYQWYDCHKEGEATPCSRIAGATNKAYTPQAQDAGYLLEGQVSAQNTTGLVLAYTAASNRVTMPAPTYSLAFGSNGSGSGQMKEDQSAAVDAGGHVWVTDGANNRIDEFSSTGSFMSSFGWGVKDGKAEAEGCTTTCQAGIAGSGNGQYQGPWGIAINTSTGNIYVSDNARVQLLSSSASSIRSFGSLGTGAGQFGGGTKGVALDSTGNVWVVDSANHRIEEFSSAGNFMLAAGWGVADEKAEAEVCTAVCYAGIAGSGNGQLSSSADGLAVSGGNVYVVDTSNTRIDEFSSAGAYVAKFGSLGSGEGQFLSPVGIATEPVSGDLYVSECVNKRVQIFNPAGGYVGKFGEAGTGNGQFTCATAVASTSSGELYVGDLTQDRVQKFKPAYSTSNPLPEPPAPGTNSVTTVEYQAPLSGSGLTNMTAAEVAKWGQTDVPAEAMAIFPPDKPMGWPAKEYERATVTYMDSQGRTVNVASPSGGISTSEYNELNEVKRTLSVDNRALALAEGSKSAEVSKKLDTESTYESGRLKETLGPEHAVRLAVGKEKPNEEAQARDHVKYFYDEGSPEGKTYNLVTKTTDAALLSGGTEADKREAVTSYTGPGNQENLGWKLRKPTSVTTDPSGLKLTKTTVYEPEPSMGNVIETKTPAGVSGGSSGWVYSSQFSSGSLAHAGGDAIDSHGNVWIANDYGNNIDKFSSSGSLLGTYAEWGTGNGQVEEPDSIAVNTTTNNVYVGDLKNNRVDEFNEKGEFVRKFGSEGTGNGQFKGVSGITIASGNVWVSDPGNDRVEEFNENGEFIKKFGTEGSGNGQFYNPSGLAFSGGNLYVVDTGNSRVEKFNTSGEYVTQFGTKGTGNGQLTGPEGMAADPAGNLYVADGGNNRIEEFTSAGAFVTTLGEKGAGNGQFTEVEALAISSTYAMYVMDAGNNRIQVWAKQSVGNPGAHETKTAYYTAEGESEVAVCRNHPEWVGLACQSRPAAQPENGSPELPVTTMTYNLWDEVEVSEEKFGSTVRKDLQTYDAAGRALTSEESASPVTDTALPKVTNEYNAETGVLEKQSTTEGTTKTITSVNNTLGQRTKYTDADGGVSTYVYEEGSDGRLTELSVAGKGSQTYSYNATTGFMTKLVDSAAGSFSATYDVEGKMLTEGFPNAMTATNTYNQIGQATGIAYTKIAHCKTTCPETWFSDSIVPAIHGETLKQASTLSEEPSYSYDAAGRLTQVQETPAGKGCKTRAYTYDQDSNRTGLTTGEPNAKGECTTEDGVLQAHSYDTADRLADSGVTYETFGNTTKLPASDAGEYELTSSYYVDGQVAGQTQNGETIKYFYDPAGRTREAVSTGKTSATTISHYAGPGGSVMWTSEGSEKWTRNIPGIDGALDAAQKSGEPAVLQLHDLKGDIVGTAALGEAETKLLSSYNSTEYGVPTTGAPPKYSWLGANGVSSELALSSGSGVSTQGGASYVPQIARDLQTTPAVPPGAFPDGSGTGGRYSAEIPGWSTALANAESAATLAEYAAKQQALEAERVKMEEEEAAFEDPCSSVYGEQKDTSGILGGNVEVAAWADLSYCWGGGKLQSVHLDYHRERTKSGFLDIRFAGWEKSHWWVGQSEQFEITAKFSWDTACPLDAPPACGPFGKFYIHLRFEIGPFGESTASAEFQKQLF